MGLFEAVRDIRAANESNRLVIFVGAGVSRNSGLPSWSELVSVFAEKLGYERCDFCAQQRVSCDKCECKLLTAYTSDELIKIPQYFYNTFGEQEYYQVIKACLSKEQKPNVIDDLVFQLLPHYIITTNYDRLLENSHAINRALYSVIVKDEDLLYRNEPRCIIKMHGDLEYPQTIVLKEDDYLEYEQKHLLIQTLIKALLIDHTFLFIGYSLTDYNLKLIISWINYFAKTSVLSTRPTNYLVQVAQESYSEYITKYYKHSNIEVIDATQLPKELLKTCRRQNLSSPGTYLFACLKAILYEENDSDLVTAVERFWPQYKVFLKYRRPAFSDIAKIQNFCSYHERYGYTLILHNEIDFDRLTGLLCTDDIRTGDLRRLYILSGVHNIRYSDKEIVLIGQEDSLLPDAFQFYLNNDYPAMLHVAEESSDPLEKAYYDYLVFSDLSVCRNDLIKAADLHSLLNDIASLLIYKWDLVLIEKLVSFSTEQEQISEIEKIFEITNHKEKAALSYFEMLYHGQEKLLSELRGLFDKHEITYLHSPDTFSFGENYGEIYEMQTLVYDFYFFYKQNFMFLDRFKNPKTIFSLYARAILCTYSPKNPKSTKWLGEFDCESLQSYVINDYDFDIIVKYIDFEELRKWQSQYKVKKLDFSASSIATKFVNLLDATIKYGNRSFIKQLCNFLVLVELIELEKDEVEIIISSAIQKLYYLSKDEFEYRSFIICLTRCITHYSKVLNDYGTLILMAFLKRDEIERLVPLSKNSISEFAKKFFSNADPTVFETVCECLADELVSDSIKCDLIYAFRKVIGKNKFKEFKGYINEHILEFDMHELFVLGAEGYIKSFGRLQYLYAEKIEDELERRKRENSRILPDRVIQYTNGLALLVMFGYNIKKELLKKYAEYSEFLAFLANPSEFDYSKVNTEDYMWANLYRDQRFVHFFIEHKKEILTCKIEESYYNDLLSHDQEKLILHYLLDDEELWKFGKS